MIRREPGLIYVLLAALLTVGCSPLAPVPIEHKNYVLSKLPADIPLYEAHRATLLVAALHPAPVYATRRIAYSTNRYEISYYRDHQWGENPGDMIQALLVSAFKQTGFFRAVVVPPVIDGYSFALESQLVELIQDYRSDPPVSRVTMRVQLRDNFKHRIIASDEFSMRVTMKGKGPYAGVMAANEAIAAIVGKTLDLVLERLKSRGSLTCAASGCPFRRTTAEGSSAARRL